MQAAQALPRPAAERPTKQFACRLRSDDKPISLSWRDECGPRPTVPPSTVEKYLKTACPRSALLCGGSTGRAYIFSADPAELGQPRQGKHATGAPVRLSLSRRFRRALTR